MIVSRQQLLSLHRPGVLIAILAAQLAVVLPLTLFLPIWVSAVVLSLIGYRALNDRLGWPMPHKILLMLLTLACAGGIYLQFGTVAGRDAGVSLIVLMFGLKLMELHKYRDAILVVFLSYFLLVTALLYNQSLFMAIYLLVAVFIITASLRTLNSVAGYQSLKMSASGAGAALLQAIPLMLILFFLFPRLPGPLWNMPGKNSGGTGISDTMTPGDIATLQLFDDPAFRVRFKGDAPDPADMYWRGLVLSNFDGLAWKETVLRRKPDVRVDALGPEYQYDIALEPHRSHWLFFLDLPVQVPPDAFWMLDYTLRSQLPVRQRLEYSGVSVMSYQFGEKLSELERRINLQLPSDDGNDRSRQWAADTRANSSSDAEYVRRLLRHINQHPFYYTLQPPILDEDIIDSFWFGTRRGFCEHYASAFVYLARAAGIPARVVTGYQGGEYNEYGNYWIIRQYDAHAWTEVWLEQEGWKRVDPTGAIAPQRVEDDLLEDMRNRQRSFADDGAFSWEPQALGLWQSLQDNMATINRWWDNWVLEFNSDMQMRMFEKLGLPKVSGHQLAIAMISILSLALLLLAFWLLRLKPKGDALSQLYQKLCNKLAAKGFHRKENEGPHDFFNRVLQARPEWRDSLEPAFQRYIQLRFSGVQSARKLSLLKKNIRELQLT